MPTVDMAEVVRRIRGAALRQGTGPTDGELLDAFVRRRDAAALDALVRRHAPMVWGVCRRILRNHQDAEDAFQATFLVLVRRASCVRPRSMAAAWLYGVARQVARKARAAAAGRASRERQAADMPEPEARPREPAGDLSSWLDDELARLPDKYRCAVVLCDLEGKTRKEAAAQLGLPEGTVASRLARGRAMLTRRLTRTGLAISAASLGAALSREAACAPAPLVPATIRAAVAAASGQAVAAVASAKVAALTERMLKAMMLIKFKVMTALVLAAGAAALGGGLLIRQAPGRPGDAGRPPVALTPPQKDGSRESAPVGPEAGADDPPRNSEVEPDVVVNVRTFKLPIQVSPDQRSVLKEVRLFASHDRGKTWEMAGAVAPDADAFVFSAPSDGLYWFALQTVGRDGAAQPSELCPTTRPALKALVKTSAAPEKEGPRDGDGKADAAVSLLSPIASSQDYFRAPVEARGRLTLTKEKPAAAAGAFDDQPVWATVLGVPLSFGGDKDLAELARKLDGRTVIVAGSMQAVSGSPHAPRPDPPLFFIRVKSLKAAEDSE